MSAPSSSATATAPLHPAKALSGLLQQSPWLLADREAAPLLLGLLKQVARFPAFELRLGADSYASPAALRAVLEPEVLTRSTQPAPWRAGA